MDANQGIVFQRVLIEKERLQNETNLSYQLYNTTAQQVQQARAKVQQETPVIAVLQSPVIPAKKTKPSKLKILVAWMFLGFCGSAAWYIWGKEWWPEFRASLKKKDDEVEPDSVES